jgi:hypothetical protein
MKHIKLYEQFVNEAANLPKEAKELAKMFKGGSWKPHFDLDDVWIFNSSELKDVDLQINWNSSEDWGNIGFQIADEDGNEIYTGKDPKKAAASIKSNEQFVNEDKFKMALGDMEDWMPDDMELQDEYYALTGSGDIDGLISFFDEYADTDTLKKYGIKYADLKKLAKTAINL